MLENGFKESMKKSKEDRRSLCCGLQGSSRDKEKWKPILEIVCELAIGTGVVEVGDLPT